MTSSQTSLRRQTLQVLCLRDARPSLAAIALLALGTSMPSMPTLASELSLGNSLEATPLVLKDGRIARVSIHTIPFPEDAAALASTTAMELETLTQTVATDCFLTAQVIGHVGKTETDGRDTVDIHRLARARADTIQQSLIVNGLPETSIASVWDWQFMVQDARATLWVFQLAAGNDCDNDMLSPPPSAKVVAMEERAPAKAAEPKPADLAGARPETVEQRVVGLVDVDAITLSMARLSQAGGNLDTVTAARAILFAVVSNTVVKGGFVMVAGSANLRRVILPGLILILGAALISAFVLINAG
jgi:hypothetical protein